MRPIVVDLVDYVERGTAGSTLARMLETVGAIEVRIVAIKLLGWLKESARKERRKPLLYNKNHTWCQNLLILLSDVPQLDELIAVEEKVIVFRDTVPADERAQIEQYVDAHYNPKLRI